MPDLNLIDRDTDALARGLNLLLIQLKLMDEAIAETNDMQRRILDRLNAIEIVVRTEPA